MRAVSTVEIGEHGRVVWPEGYGLIRVFEIVAADGDVEWWAASKVEMNDLERVRCASFAWTIKNYHRGIKQFSRRYWQIRGATGLGNTE